MIPLYFNAFALFLFPLETFHSLAKNLALPQETLRWLPMSFEFPRESCLSFSGECKTFAIIFNSHLMFFFHHHPKMDNNKHWRRNLN